MESEDASSPDDSGNWRILFVEGVSSELGGGGGGGGIAFTLALSITDATLILLT